VGVPWVLKDEAQVEAFKRDWEVYKLTLAEMAAMHGFKNVNSVTRAAKRLGLAPRPGGPTPELSSPRVLTRGQWVRSGLVQVWVDEEGVA
jgi:hypothetical protein